MSSRTQQQEVDENYEAFKTLLPKLMNTDANRFALMHNRKVIACFDTGRDATLAGRTLLHGKLFSVQQVTNRAVDLGHFSFFGTVGAV